MIQPQKHQNFKHVSQKNLKYCCVILIYVTGKIQMNNY